MDILLVILGYIHFVNYRSSIIHNIMITIAPYLFIKFVFLGLIIIGVFVGGWFGLKILFKWLKKIGM